MKSFRDYHVWQRSHELALAIYRVTEGFPRAEQFGLTSQMRRSSSSVPTNIAEGAVMGDAQFFRFLTISFGFGSGTRIPVDSREGFRLHQRRTTPFVGLAGQHSETAAHSTSRNHPSSIAVDAANKRPRFDGRVRKQPLITKPRA